MYAKQHIQVLRSQLLEMSSWSQRAVDCSVKAYELGSREFCLQVLNTGLEVSELHRCITFRCRKLLVAETPVDSDLYFAWSALRICSALRTTYSATVEIAQNTLLFLENGRIPESPTLWEMGRLVNRLTRLCTVALFREEIQHARTVLQDEGVGLWFELAAYHSSSCTVLRMGRQVAFESAITKSFVQIAEQAHEMADAITFWLEEKDRTGFTREPATDVHRESIRMQRSDEVKAISFSRGRACLRREFQL